MASDKGESVAFTALYGSNLLELSKLLLKLGERKEILLDTIYEKVEYDSVIDKHRNLDKYFEACSHVVSGEKTEINIIELAKDLGACIII